VARGEGYDDEIAFSAELVGQDAPASEFNALGKLWNARVTSHIPLKECRRGSQSSGSIAR